MPSKPQAKSATTDPAIKDAEPTPDETPVSWQIESTESVMLTNAGDRISIVVWGSNGLEAHKVSYPRAALVYAMRKYLED